MEVPPPFSNLQASREEEGGEQPGRRSLEGLEECWGIWENFRVTVESKSGGFTF